MEISIKEMAARIVNYPEFCIIYHVRPDGDCIGSAYALSLALKELGKKVSVKGTYDIPPAYLDMTDRVIQDTLTDPIYVLVDTSTPDRAGEFEKTHFTFCIDHHRNNTVNADYKYIEEDCGACSEIIYKLIVEMNVKLTKEMADFMYAGLVTDTLCFRTSDTNSQTFETASKLAASGADIYGIGRRLMLIKSEGRMKIENILTASLHFTCDNKVVTGVIMLEDLHKAGIMDSELEGINSFVEQIEGIRIGVTIRELPDGKMRCSMRTNGEISASEICSHFGGGGHFHAASCIIDTDVNGAREIMEKECKKYI